MSRRAPQHWVMPTGVAPLKAYCIGLLLPGERKSVEPMAARGGPRACQAAHQSLHHFVAKADWLDDAVLGVVRAQVLPALERQGQIRAWIVDDTGFPKKGKHSVGVARQYCGQLGKQDNCQVAVSLSVATDKASLPVAYQLYLPESWANDPDCAKAGVPEDESRCERGRGDNALTARQIDQPLASRISSRPAVLDRAERPDI
ncbi:hypothetical protein X745_28700 [Mesorhizobium sp. LNJC374B00]|nr:hypothetical protein X745_28700 [Mesorhizobium sp. LNJC374B00]